LGNGALKGEPGLARNAELTKVHAATFQIVYVTGYNKNTRAVIAMRERSQNRRLVAASKLEIRRMKKILAAFNETLNSSRRRLNDAYETLKRAEAVERGEKDRLPDWMALNREGLILRPDAEKRALELRGYAERVHGHKAKQLFIAMAEEYERLAGKQEERRDI
jgi:hypothetical protein